MWCWQSKSRLARHADQGPVTKMEHNLDGWCTIETGGNAGKMSRQNKKTPFFQLVDLGTCYLTDGR
jgi:hypothetical protein